MNFSNFLALLTAIFSLIQVTSSYKHVRIQHNNICPVKMVSKVLTRLFKGKRLELGERKDSAMVIEQTWSPRTLAYVEHACTFTVHTKDVAPGSGLYTVINKLNFRKENDTCIDYLIFSGGNRPNSKPICEKIGFKTETNKESLIFNEHDHEVEIQIHINKDVPIVEPLELSMVVTQHMNCNGYGGKFQCDVNDSFSCIYSEFENDDIPNCLPPCADESGCFQSTVTSEPLVPAISALTSMIFTMIGVGGCVWACWKYWDCVKTSRLQDAEQRQRTRNVPNLETHNLEVLQPATLEINISRNNSGRTNSPKEDMPPSYESLFPEPISR